MGGLQTLNGSWGYDRDNLDWKSPETLVKMLVDSVSKDGNLLLNVGPTASGILPPPQAATLRALGAWNARHGDAVFGSRPLDGAPSSDDPWVRWTRTGDRANAFVDAVGHVEIACPPGVDPSSAVTMTDAPVVVERRGDRLIADLPAAAVAGPAVVRFLLT